MLARKVLVLITVKLMFETKTKNSTEKKNAIFFSDLIFCVRQLLWWSQLVSTIKDNLKEK